MATWVAAQPPLVSSSATSPRRTPGTEIRWARQSPPRQTRAAAAKIAVYAEKRMPEGESSSLVMIL
jgi:hypothetical protein